MTRWACPRCRLRPTLGELAWDAGLKTRRPSWRIVLARLSRWGASPGARHKT